MAKKKMSPLEKVAKRYKITAREARDIATAVGTVGKSILKSPQEDISPRMAAKNLKKQVKETGRAAAKGKKGTSSAQLQPKPFQRGEGYVFYDYIKGKKRK